MSTQKVGFTGSVTLSVASAIGRRLADQQPEQGEQGEQKEN